MARAKFEYKIAYNRPLLTVASWTVGAGYAASLLFAVYMFFNRLWIIGILLLVLGAALFVVSIVINNYIDISNVSEYKYYKIKEDVQKLWEADKITEKEYEKYIKDINKVVKEDRKQRRLNNGKS